MSNAFDSNPESEKNYIYIYIRIYLHTRTSLLQVNALEFLNKLILAYEIVKSI